MPKPKRQDCRDIKRNSIELITFFNKTQNFRKE
jgi:hypothetical protein